jgi:hypothetical protein
LPLQSIPPTTTVTCRYRSFATSLLPQSTANHILPRFVPLQRFPSNGEPLTHSDDPNTLITLHSAGFLTLSMLCSPRSLPGLFHPGPVLGVNPTRILLPTTSRYVLSNVAALLELASCDASNALRPPAGFDTSGGYQRDFRGLAGLIPWIPPWVSTLRGL